MRGVRFLPLLILAAGLALWAFQGFYDVAPDEQAIVLSLGRYSRTVDPGAFRWHAPGIETVLKQHVTTTLSAAFRFRSKPAPQGPDARGTPDQQSRVTHVDTKAH